MPNNIPVTSGSGNIVAAEDVGGVKYQQVKLIDSTAGSTTPTGTVTNPFRTNVIFNPGTVDSFGHIITGQLHNDVDVQFFRDTPENLVTVTTSGGGTATASGGSALFATGAAVTAAAKGVSNTSVSYSSGAGIYALFTARFTTPTDANSFQRIGLYDDDNGFFIGFEGTSFGVTVRKATIDTTVPKASFNLDELVGGGASRFTRAGIAEAIDFTKFNVFRVRFGWLGSAPIYFEVLSPDGGWVTFHEIYQPNSATTASIANPDLPVTVEVDKAASDATDLVLATSCWGAGMTARDIASSAVALSTTITDATLAVNNRAVLSGKDAGSGNYVNINSLETQADNVDNTVNGLIASSFGYVFDGATWDRQPGTSTDGTLVNLGTNNDVTVTSGSITVSATNLDIRDLVFASDKVDASGSTLGSNSGVDIGDVTINNAAGAAAVNIQDGGNSITVDGTVTANAGTNLNTSLLALEAGGNLAAAATSLAILDDWDESDRAKVNPIAGQAGIAAGAGTVDALTTRVAIATNANTVDTELPAAATIAADGVTPTVPGVAAYGFVKTPGADTWDRHYAVVNGLNSVGTGLAAAGIVGQFDDVATGAVTENQFAPVRISTRRALLVEGVASGTAQPISGTVTANGNLTNNNAAPTTTNFGVLPALANTNAPSYGDGNQALLSVDLSGAQRTIGIATHNGAAPTASKQLGVLPAIALTTPPSYTDGRQVLLCTDTAGSLRTAIVGTVTVDTELPAAATIAADGVTPTVPGVAAYGFVKTPGANTWDRAYAVANAMDTTGTGIPAAGILAQFDDASIGTVTENQFSTLRMSSRRCLYTEGNIAHDSADSGNPVKVGSRAVSNLGDATLVAAGDRADLVCDADSVLLARSVSYADMATERVSNTDGASTALTTFAAVASKRNYITQITVHNSHATTNGYVDIRNGTAGAIIWTIPLPATGGATIHFDPPLRQPSTNTALAFDVSAAITTVYLSFNGFQGKL